MWAPHGTADLPQPERLQLLNTPQGTNTNSPSPSSLDDACSLGPPPELFVVFPVRAC